MTNFDCSIMFVGDRMALQRVMCSSMEILRSKSDTVPGVATLRDWQIGLGRRFRALKLWFVIRTFGVAGLQQHIRHQCQLAETFEELVLQDNRFELYCPRALGLVCFRARSPVDISSANNATIRIFEHIDRSGDIFLVQSSIDGETFIRFCICSPLTTADHVESAWRSIQRAADAVLASNRAPNS